MLKYFQTNLKNVKKNGVLIENAQVVVGLSEQETLNCIEIPSKYVGCAIIGTMYDPTTQEFYQVEEVTEPSQLDRIEANTASLKSEIEQSAIDAYTLELMEEGVI